MNRIHNLENPEADSRHLAPTWTTAHEWLQAVPKVCPQIDQYQSLWFSPKCNLTIQIVGTLEWDIRALPLVPGALPAPPLESVPIGCAN